MFQKAQLHGMYCLSLISQNSSTGAYMGGAYKTILRVITCVRSWATVDYINYV